ncbi:MAG: DUF4444 domain-containing protein [Paracoccaceae bacterium]
MALSETEDQGPSFPPVFSGMAAAHGLDPFDLAVDRAQQGIESGLIVHRIRPDHLAAALVLAPETKLEDAVVMALVAAVGFADSFGSLAPSEVAVQFDWPGGLRINGAKCGKVRVAAPTRDPLAEPGWLVIGLEVPFFAQALAEPGNTPDETTLWDEGCSEIDPCRLLESWSRHTLVWIHQWLEGGRARLLREWTGRAIGIGKPQEIVLAERTFFGQFMGLDEKGGMLLKSAGTTQLLPLTLMLEGVGC